MTAFPNTIKALDLAINEVKARAIEEAERRGKIATRGLIVRLSVAVVPTPWGGVARMEGDDYWKYVGNGRGPGGMPPVGKLQQWIDAKGLDLSAWAVAKRMAREGSRDYRLRAPNVFMSAVDDFEQGGGLDRLEADAGDELENVAADAVVKNFKRV